MSEIMDKSGNLSSYMENSLNAYRSAIKSFGREALALGLLAIVVCTLTISYLNGTARKHIKEKEIKSIQERVGVVRNAKSQLEEILKDLSSEKEIIQQIAKETSTDLVNRWQAFLKAIQGDFSIFMEHPDLFEKISSSQPAQISVRGFTGASNLPVRSPDIYQMQIQRPDENQPGFQHNNTPKLPEKTLNSSQMAFPPYHPSNSLQDDYYISPEYLKSDVICKEVYGISDKEISMLMQPDILSGNTFRNEDAYNIALEVFKDQIKWGYEKLNERMLSRYFIISKVLDNNVQGLNQCLKTVNLDLLPTGKALLTEPNKVEPSDLKSYATVRDKMSTMIRDTRELTDRLDITESVLSSIDANVRQTEEMFRKQNKKMKSEIDNLVKNIARIKDDIDKLQVQIKNQFKFASWMPGGMTVGTQTFIRITPLLLGIIMLLMGIRYSRLTQIYHRLVAQLRKYHSSEEEISLILTAPDSLLEWFGGFQPGRLRSPKAALLVIPVGILVVIYLLVHKILQNPLIEPGGYGLFAAAFITACLGATLVYGTVFRSVFRK